MPTVVCQVLGLIGAYVLGMYFTAAFVKFVEGENIWKVDCGRRGGYTDGTLVTVVVWPVGLIALAVRSILDHGPTLEGWRAAKAERKRLMTERMSRLSAPPYDSLEDSFRGR